MTELNLTLCCTCEIPVSRRAVTLAPNGEAFCPCCWEDVREDLARYAEKVRENSPYRPGEFGSYPSTDDDYDPFA